MGADSYPGLEMHGHSIFFAESVKAVIEVKSNWSTEAFTDIKEKCERIRNMLLTDDLNLADHIARLEQDVIALSAGRAHEGMLITKPKIGTAAVVLSGGETFGPDQVSDEEIDTADDYWPDVLLLLSAGYVVIKRYEPTGPMTGIGWLEFVRAGDDALLVFTSALLDLLSDRAVQLAAPFYFDLYTEYAIGSIVPEDIVEFPVRRSVPGRSTLWK